MKNLTLADLKLGLDNLIGARGQALARVRCADTYAPLLKQKLSGIAALPAALTGTPLAKELDQTDLTHDEMAAGVWHVLEAHLSISSTPAAVREAAQRIRQDLVPTLAGTQAAYPDQAAAAKEREPALERRKADLQMFPVAGGGTLYDWAAAHVQAGVKMDSLLSSRADLAAPSVTSRKQAGVLRNSTVGLLGRLRAAVRDECSVRTDLPQNTEEQLFSYLDALSSHRAAKGPAAEPLAPPA
ncbi:MAG: hypothetical protein HY904_19970 [Deltaproteobacteria bacterium]|nr:hypothetical protein [Deltaproteobacteria bacterium]